MENVTVGWIKNDSITSERKIPYIWNGKRNIKLGSKNDIDIILLEGYNKLDETYINSLQNLGYSIVDASDIYNKYKIKYNVLNRFGDYEKKCFLRWLVINDLYGESPIIHYDGDVVFNCTPENLICRFGKFTFVLQGCPAFVSIRDTSWFEIYKKNLDKFTNNIEKYSANAWKQRQRWEQSFKYKWAGSRYRKIITSDQDLISHLIHIDELPQDNPHLIRWHNKDIILFENPLYFFVHNMDMAPFIYQRKNGVDYFNNKKVAFWHMQSSFTGYLKHIYILRYLLKLRKFKITNPLEGPDPILLNKFKNTAILHYLGIIRNLDRIHICKYFFDKSDLSEVFNNKVFWYFPNKGDDLHSINYL